MSFVNSDPLTDAEWDLSGAYFVDDSSYLVSPSPDQSQAAPAPPPYMTIRSRGDAAREELRALGLSTASSLEEVVAAIRRHHPAGLKNVAINPHTGLPSTPATERWAAG